MYKSTRERGGEAALRFCVGCPLNRYHDRVAIDFNARNSFTAVATTPRGGAGAGAPAPFAQFCSNWGTFAQFCSNWGTEETGPLRRLAVTSRYVSRHVSRVTSRHVASLHVTCRITSRQVRVTSRRVTSPVTSGQVTSPVTSRQVI